MTEEKRDKKKVIKTKMESQSMKKLHMMISDGIENINKGPGKRNEGMVEEENVNDTIRGFETKVGRQINESDGRAIQ